MKSTSSLSSLENLNDDVLGLICQTVYELTKANAEWLSSSDFGCATGLFNGDSDSDTDSDFETECSSESDAQAEYWSWPPTMRSAAKEIDRMETPTMDISLHMGFQEEPDHIRELPRTLAEVFFFISGSQTTRPRLNSLTMSIDEDRAHLLKEAISVLQAEQPTKLEFPGIRRLTVGPNNEFFLKHCPNTEVLIMEENRSLCVRKRIDADQSFSIIREAGKLERLKCLVMRESWTEDLMKSLYEAVPRLRMLWLEEGPHTSMSFELFLEYISKFENLEKLGVASVPYLNESVQPYFSRDDYEEWQQQVEDAEDRIARMILGGIGGRCKNVQEVWFGFRTCHDVKRARVRLDEKGKKEIEWWVGKPGPEWS
ncbi:hypothetical protein VKT23_007410 [Stygiomarasmius scandens]|uniref:Uncharacterized protein n=1 Tax=Marasmiellus scandens TaxID=2682957 RepID=A0ABR1JML4_9AGAR